MDFRRGGGARSVLGKTPQTAAAGNAGLKIAQGGGGRERRNGAVAR